MKRIYRLSVLLCRWAALGVLLAAHSMCAQVDIYDSYPAICNDGEKPFWLATAYNTVRGWISDDRWEIDGWFQVDPHKCKEPGSFKFESRDIGKHPIVLWAVAFVDGEGHWGWVRVHADADKDYGMWRAKDVPLCVTRDAFHYTSREGEQDAPSDDQCSKPGFFKIMSTFQSWPVIEETRYGSGVYGSRKPELHTEIPSDLKVFPPLGANASTNSAGSQPTVKHERESGSKSDSGNAGELFIEFLKYVGKAAEEQRKKNNDTFFDIIKDSLVGPGAPRLRRRACPASRSCDDIEVCAPKSFVDGYSWSSEKNADFLKTELRNYVSTHVVGNFPALQRSDGPVGTVSIQVGETGAHDVLSEEISDCGNLEHVFSTFLHKVQWASDGQPSQPGQEQTELPPPGPGASIESAPEAPIKIDIGTGIWGNEAPKTQSIHVQLCLPKNLVPLGWNHPPAGSEMEAFQKALGDYADKHGDSDVQLRVTDGAWEIFDRAWRASAAVNEELLGETVPLGQPCPPQDETSGVRADKTVER